MNSHNIQLKSYAAITDQSFNIESWDTPYKGYVSPDSRIEFLFVLGPAISLVLIFTMCAFPVAYKKGYIENQKRIESYGPYRQLFFSVSGIITIINIVYYTTDAGFFVKVMYQQSILKLNSYFVTEGIRFAFQSVSVLICFIVACVIQVWKAVLVNSKSNNYVPSVCCLYTWPYFCACARVEEGLEDEGLESLLTSLKRNVCCVCGFIKCSNICKNDCCGSSCENSYEIFVIFNYLAFLCIIAWGIVPTITLIFVNPVLTLAIVSFVVVFFILSAILFALLFVVRDRKKKKWRQTVLVYYQSTPKTNTLEMKPSVGATGSASEEVKKKLNKHVFCMELCGIQKAKMKDQKKWCKWPFECVGVSNTELTENKLYMGCCKCDWRLWSRFFTYSIFWDFFWVLTLAIVLFLFGSIVVLVIYVGIVNKGAGDGGSVGFIIAFVPTIITGGAAWLGKKALFRPEQKSKENVESGVDGTITAATANS